MRLMYKKNITHKNNFILYIFIIIIKIKNKQL